ncbi:MAG TPA: hypothetical protein VHF47_04445 [Acidimicrobiales bacterium]|nr:hypothetical protein [Acidimicrobiales bacterium]
MRAVTTPEEWRRRAGSAAPKVVDGDLRSAVAGLAALDAGDEATAREAARVCRSVVESQPDDVPGVSAAPGLVVAAHAGPQPFGMLGTAVGFLARAFELWGDDADLDAAVELHDLVVALGDDVWDGPEAWRVGWGAALLYSVTGDEAFLATTERVADLLCETQRPDGTWGSPEATAEAALVLREMADAVEGRAGVE